MDKASDIMFSMFEAFRVSVKLDIAKKANLEELDELKNLIPNYKLLQNIDTRLSFIEVKFKEMLWDEDREEEKDEVQGTLTNDMDDLDLSLEKERRRKGLSHMSVSESPISEHKGEALKYQESAASLDEYEDSFSQFRSLANTGTKASATDVGHSQRIFGRIQRQMLILIKDNDQIRNRIDDLSISLSKLNDKLIQAQEQVKDVHIVFQRFDKQKFDLNGESKALRNKISEIEKLHKSYKNLSEGLRTELRDNMNILRKESSNNLSRVVNIDSKVDSTSAKFLLFKNKTNENVRQCVEYIKLLATELEKLKNSSSATNFNMEKLESTVKGELLRVVNDVESIKSPVHDFTDVYKRESESLVEEVKRNQELFRRLAVEYTSLVSAESPANIQNRTTGMGSSDFTKLKGDSMKIRPETSSPSRRIRASSAIVDRRQRRISDQSISSTTEKSGSVFKINRVMRGRSELFMDSRIN